MPRILIIDNSQIIRDMLGEYLDDLGYEVDMAVHGQEGIEKGLANDYDVVFCDTHMPKRNGLQVYLAVSEKKPNLPFIMTDSLPDDLSEEALNRGAVACLLKPFNLDLLKTTLESLFKETRTK